MREQIRETSPRSLARMAGVCQALEGLTATSGEVTILDKLVVSGNAMATAANILGHERLFWLGFRFLRPGSRIPHCLGTSPLRVA